MDVGARVDRFVVEGVLGHGATATVYAVRHRTLGTRSALKHIPDPPRELRERLLREARIQAGLRHPNIVPVLDVLELPDGLGLLMERVDGPTLTRWLDRKRPSVEEATLLFRGIVAGVAAAHARGLVHRDLKPDNVLIDAAADSRPRITDFGMARELGQRITRTGAIIGTPAYMAPEQLRDASRAGPAADIWALGCILYELCCQAVAFPQRDFLGVAEAIRLGRFEGPLQHVPELPEAVVRTILGCLRPALDERFSSCDEVLASLDDRRTRSTLVALESGELLPPRPAAEPRDRKSVV